MVVAAVQEAAAHTRSPLGLELLDKVILAALAVRLHPIMAAAVVAAQVQRVQMARHP